MTIHKLAGIALILGMSTVFAGCGDDDDEGGGPIDVEAFCEKYCTKVAPLNCSGTPAETCVADCKSESEEDLGVAPEACLDEIAAASRCLDARPASDYECDEFDDEALPKEGVCQAQQLAVFACVIGG